MNNVLFLKSIQSKDEHTFKYLFDIYWESLYSYIYKNINNRQDAEEITLDIFMYLWEHSNQINHPSALKSYLFQAAHNRCLNFLRDSKQHLSLDEAGSMTEDSIDSLLEKKEVFELINKAVHTLPNRCHQVFFLSKKKNMTNREIADKMNISVKTVESQMTKALKHIRNFLDIQYT